MSKKNSYSDGNDSLILEQKILILFLVDKFDKMELAISDSKLSEFILESNYMNIFRLRECLHELEEASYIEKTTDNATARYSITEAGMKALEHFQKQLPTVIRNNIIKYVDENRSAIRREYEITTQIFPNDSGDYVVRCGAYDNEDMLMELHITVYSHRDARTISNNWKTNVNSIFNTIITEVTKEPKNDGGNE